MIKRERKASQCLRKRLCALCIAAPRAALKQGYRFLKRQHVKRDLIGQFAPVGEPRRDQHTRPSGWQKVRYLIRRGDVVVNEEPCRALLSKPTQRSLSGLLDVGFLRHRRTQRHGKGRIALKRPVRVSAGHQQTPAYRPLKRCAYSTASEVLPTPPMPCTAARPTDTCVTAAGLSCIRMASSRSSSSARPVKLAMRGGTPMNGRGGGANACERPSAAEGYGSDAPPHPRCQQGLDRRVARTDPAKGRSRNAG